MKKTNYLISGTLGDCYIALRKLQDYAMLNKLDENELHVEYAADTDEHHEIVQKMFRYMSDICISENIILFQSNMDLRRCIRNFSGHFINHTWNGKISEIEKKQSLNVRISTSKKELTYNSQLKKRIAIQLHTGKKNKNEKILHFKFVNKIIAELLKLNCTIHLYGTGKELSEKIVKNPNVKNEVGQLKFEDWLDSLKQADFLISPEGFSLFFALDHGVRCISFYEYEYIFDRIAPHWRKNGIFYTSITGTLQNRIWRKFRRELGRPNFLRVPDALDVSNHIKNQVSYL